MCINNSNSYTRNKICFEDSMFVIQLYYDKYAVTLLKFKVSYESHNIIIRAYVLKHIALYSLPRLSITDGVAVWLIFEIEVRCAI